MGEMKGKDRMSYAVCSTCNDCDITWMPKSRSLFEIFQKTSFAAMARQSVAMESQEIRRNNANPGLSQPIMDARHQTL